KEIVYELSFEVYFFAIYPLCASLEASYTHHFYISNIDSSDVEAFNPRSYPAILLMMLYIQIVNEMNLSMWQVFLEGLRTSRDEAREQKNISSVQL
ncbi:hypothetical protein TGAM01_v204890, partial [Trichoderma gamsii]